MDVFRSKPVICAPQNAPAESAGEVPPTADPRLQPTPDYGTLGPDSDAAKYAGSPASATEENSQARPSPTPDARRLSLAAVLGGVMAALAARGGPAVLGKVVSMFTPEKNVHVSSRVSPRDLDRQKPQMQAETLLTRAVSRSDGAADEIQSHIEGWRGKLQWNPQLGQLTTAALNSNDLNVRVSAIEVQLAAYGLDKNDSTIDTLMRRAQSSDHAQKIWALWALGLLGNRGVQSDRVVKVLTAHLLGPQNDSDEDSRRWATEGLALVGTTSTIAPLLEAMHNDSSRLVRERAACSLAESGMLTHEQRLTAVPQLISYSDDPALDAQTHAWAFQALSDITKQRLPNDSAAWRNWYETSVVSSQ